MLHPTTHEPYLAFRDSDKSGKATVMRFTGGTWLPVGSRGFSTGAANYLSLALLSTSAYVAYRDGGNSNKATVMTFAGTAWSPVGSPGFSGGQADYISLALHPTSGAPYVAFADSTVAGATLMFFNGTADAWSPVGPRGFSNTTSVTAVSLALHPTTGAPYVAYMDLDYLINEGCVVTYRGGSWNYVGPRGFTRAFPLGTQPGRPREFSMAMHPTTGALYMAYHAQGLYGSFATAVTYSNTSDTAGSWSAMGPGLVNNSIFPGCVYTTQGHVSLALHPPTGAPYVAFTANRGIPDYPGSTATVARYGVP